MAEGKGSSLTHVQMVLIGVIQDLLAQPHGTGGERIRERKREESYEWGGSSIQQDHKGPKHPERFQKGGGKFLPKICLRLNKNPTCLLRDN